MMMAPLALAWATLLFLAVSVGVVSATVTATSTPSTISSLHQSVVTTFYRRPSTKTSISQHYLDVISSARRTYALQLLRGGARADDDEFDDGEYDEEIEDNDKEPIVMAAKKLATSTKSTILQKKATSTKAKVSAALSPKATDRIKSRPVSFYKRYVPYIVRACLNPFTFVAMSRAYFASLFDINFLKEDPSQNLRSALEEKAKRQAPSTNNTNKNKRKMKPGQAKTLSDLPKLSA